MCLSSTSHVPPGPALCRSLWPPALPGEPTWPRGFEATNPTLGVGRVLQTGRGNSLIVRVFFSSDAVAEAPAPRDDVVLLQVTERHAGRAGW